MSNDKLTDSMDKERMGLYDPDYLKKICGDKITPAERGWIDGLCNARIELIPMPSERMLQDFRDSGMPTEVKWFDMHLLWEPRLPAVVREIKRRGMFCFLNYEPAVSPVNCLYVVDPDNAQEKLDELGLDYKYEDMQDEWELSGGGDYQFGDPNLPTQYSSGFVDCIALGKDIDDRL